jgi:hypothetical protein
MTYSFFPCINANAVRHLEGGDIKYGINDAFAILIPDFGLE